MSAPFTGVLAIILGVFSFFFLPEVLYACLIISIPFSAMVVFNIGSAGGEKGISVWLFLCSLWMFREIVSGRPFWQKPGWLATRGSRRALFSFWGIAALSLCVPLLLAGTSWVPNPEFMSSETIPLRFGIENLTQTAYLGFGIALAVLIAAENCRLARLFYTLKLYVGSCTFVAGWGLFQLWCNVTGFPYPAYLFNTSATESALGYREMLPSDGGIGLARISSVALEPSVFAEELLLALIVLLVCIGIGKCVIGRRFDIVATAVIVLALLTSTSTTAYAGLIVVLPMTVISIFRTGRHTRVLFLILTATLVIGFGLVALNLVPDFSSILFIGKLTTASGIERVDSVRLAYQDFLRYPLLGVGWHAVTSWDLVLLILSNMGVLGLLAFISFLVPVMFGLWKAIPKRGVAAPVLFSCLALATILSELSGLTYSAGYDWLVFGLAAAALALVQTRTDMDAKNGGELLPRLSTSTEPPFTL